MRSLSLSAAEEPSSAVPGEVSPAGATTPDLDGSLVSTLFAFLGCGLLLAFTPCVLPIVPILSGMLTRSAEKLSWGRGFALSASYVLAMAGSGFSLPGSAATFSDPADSGRRRPDESHVCDVRAVDVWTVRAAGAACVERAAYARSGPSRIDRWRRAARLHLRPDRRSLRDAAAGSALVCIAQTG